MEFSAMLRILGMERRNRVTRIIRIEKELLEIIKEYNFCISDLVNVLPEKHFREKGLL
jgi:hypothetical protein